jgi:hypothetical protein
MLPGERRGVQSCGVNAENGGSINPGPFSFRTRFLWRNRLAFEVGEVKNGGLRVENGGSLMCTLKVGGYALVSLNVH